MLLVLGIGRLVHPGVDEGSWRSLTVSPSSIGRRCPVCGGGARRRVAYHHIDMMGRFFRLPELPDGLRPPSLAP